MKKMVLTFLSLMAFSTFMLALNPPVRIPIYRFKTPTGWTEETNPTLANATATNEWNSDGYVALLSTYQTSKINWELNVSQWIYVNIKYLEFNIHVNMPGDYTIDNLDISVKTNGKVKVYMGTPGDLSDGNGHSIPTWIGYVENQNETMLPKLGETNVNFSWLRMGELPDENNPITILNPCGTIHPCGLGTKTYQVWFGFKINSNTCKGTYSTYLDIFIQPEP
ncbi:hypothetical protein [Mesoaciditoga sp.]